MQAISDQACKVLHLFGKDVERVATTVGPEQEYFLIRKEDYNKRLDLVLTGRTPVWLCTVQGPGTGRALLWCDPPHCLRLYEGSGHRAVEAGHPRKDQDNEVAPCQHELCPHLRYHQRCHRPQPSDHGNDEEGLPISTA